METIFVIFDTHTQCLFKSYYVVWKPPDSLGLLADRTPFKSYYVVWKLFSILFVFILFLSFKSYYVVWKPCVESSTLILFFIV